MRPGGGATYPGIPSMEVLSVVTPEEEEVTPYPEICSTIWFHDVGGATSEAPIQLQQGLGLQQWRQNPTPVATSSSWSRATTWWPKSWLSLGGSACRHAAMSWTKVAQHDKLQSP